MGREFFPLRPDAHPMIYAYTDSNPAYAGQLKVGYTTINVEYRVGQQYPVIRPGERPYKIVLKESAIRSDGTTFMDHDVHRCLRAKGFENTGGEWFRCTVDDVKAAVVCVRERTENIENRTETFAMRPEQADAVERTMDYFRKMAHDEPSVTPHYLWNCKMRFGKTFTAYQLAKRMGWKRVLVLTFKPAVEDAWEDDLNHHVDFEGWQFISSKNPNFTYDDADHARPIVCFGSFQDYLGKNKAGGIKEKNEWVHAINWDCVIFDEYHYGAWRENAKDLFEGEDSREQNYENGNGLEYYDESLMPITTDHYLYLSGTPFRAITSGEFIEEQIYNWTYSDEQRAKAEWDEKNGKNPYAALPMMVLMTYQLPDTVRSIAMGGEFNEFDLNVFFAAEGDGDEAKFTHEDEVQKWLDMIRGSYSPNSVDDLKLGNEKPPMPFSHAPLLQTLTHTLWFLPTVASCFAMRNLLESRQNTFYKDYKVITAAGTAAGIGLDALPPVRKAMGNPLETKTITLTCGKLTTGVTIRPWSGIFMLRNSSSPETYFQAAFRVQSPWTIMNPDGLSPDKEEILKDVCYVFDFAPNRALRQIAEYSCRLNVNEKNPEKNVGEFINFLPVLAYDGSSMKQIDAAGILDMAMSGTTATLLARKWQSAVLVNVDNNTLSKLLASDDAMKALGNIEGFRNLNQDIETLINRSEQIKNAKKKANEQELDKTEKKQLSEAEKEYRSKRKEIQEKLLKFAARIPVFMYLTDYRERCLYDVIKQLEPGLFKKVTGLEIKDFDLLVSLGVFNDSLMNDAVFKFKQYEDASLTYAGGIDRHEADKLVGLYNTTVTTDEFHRTFVNEPAD
jgi:hypothetical protein